MNLIDNQVINVKPLSSLLKIKILVIVIGRFNQYALNSLREQIYTNFRVCLIDKEFDDFSESFYTLEEGNIIETNLGLCLKKITVQASDEYIYLLDGCDALAPHAFLEFARHIKREPVYDVLYANEAIGNITQNIIYTYEIKPLPSKIAILQSFCIGKAILWSRRILINVLEENTEFSLNIMYKKLFLLALLHGAEITSLSSILLIKNSRKGEYSFERKLLPLLQQNIEKYTEWEGIIGRSNSFSLNGVELYSDKLNLLTVVGFIVIEKELRRTLQLISQLGISCSENEVVIAAKLEHKHEILSFCKTNKFSHFKIITQHENFGKLLQEMIIMLESPYHIILNDLVQWLNRMNLERLLKAFLKPEVMIAVPQVATEGKEGKDPILVYAGAGINNLSLNESCFGGRSQSCQCEQDMAWTNYEVSMLTPYCFAARKTVWKELFPLHDSVCTLQHFINEISFLCLQKNIICEYVAQSSVWVAQEVAEYLLKNKDTGEINLGEAQCANKSNYFWHALSTHGQLIEEKRKEIPLLLQGNNPYIEEDFHAFGLKNITMSGKKRALILTHELSLTGAPLVLVQAVKVLVNEGIDVLIVSPKDGPLRETYLSLGLPVIIDAQLQSSFGYISFVHDFDFVVVSTVVLWNCIEVLGKTNIPVLWWVHDSRIGYENYLRYELPDKIGDNIKLYCGGEYARKVITDYRPNYTADILLYGLEDFSGMITESFNISEWKIPKDKLIFANIGQITKRKGQDILVKAIRNLPEEDRERCVFVFVGSIIDRGLFKEIELLMKEMPQNIVYIKQMPYDTLKQFYKAIDCVICSSTDDPLPAFVAEAMMMGNVCICSENTAFLSLIQSGQEGYLFESGNVAELCDRIRSVVKNPEIRHEMGGKARTLYKDTFSPAIFKANFMKVINKQLLGSDEN